MVQPTGPRVLRASAELTRGRRLGDAEHTHRKNPFAHRGGQRYFRDGRARDRGGGTRERVDKGAPLGGHGRAIGRPGAPSTSTPERHDRAIQF